MIDFLTATDEELKSFLETHPAHVTLLNAARDLDGETVSVIATVATAYTAGASDADVIETMKKALAFWGRYPATSAKRGGDAGH